MLLFDLPCHFQELSQRNTTLLYPHLLSARANRISDDVRLKAFSTRRPDILPPSLPSQISLRRSRLKSKLCAERPFGCQRSIPPPPPPPRRHRQGVEVATSITAPSELTKRRPFGNGSSHPRRYVAGNQSFPRRTWEGLEHARLSNGTRNIPRKKCDRAL